MSHMLKRIALVSFVLAAGCVGSAFAQDGNSAEASFEAIVPSLAKRGDYGSLASLSRLYLALANAYKGANDQRGACAALSQSFDYYRQAMANEPHTPSYERAASVDELEDSGMKEVRAEFGCSRPSGAPLLTSRR